MSEEKERLSEGEPKKYIRIPTKAIHFDDSYWNHIWQNEPIHDKWIEQIEDILNKCTFTISLFENVGE